MKKKGILILGLVVLVIGIGWPFGVGRFFTYANPLVRGIVTLYGIPAAEICNLNVALPGRLRPGVLTAAEMNALKGGNWLSMMPGDDSPDAGKQVTLLTVPPYRTDYRWLNRMPVTGARVVVESSEIDQWHTTPAGLRNLKKMRPHALRVVVFDGGHHLPTLALLPDVIIVPVTSGYAAHGYMKDAISLQKLVRIIRREHLPCAVMTMPRWALIKTEQPMAQAAVRCVSLLPEPEARPEPMGTVLEHRVTMRQDAAYIYIASGGGMADDLAIRLKKNAIRRVYLGVNYGAVSPEEARQMARKLAAEQLNVQLVNEPCNVMQLMIRGK